MKRTNAKLIKHLAAVEETPIAPAWMVAAITLGMEGQATGVTANDMGNVKAEGLAVIELSERLADLPSAWPLESMLL